jgi:glutamate dehydrogenase/leucine dehydrogenase
MTSKGTLAGYPKAEKETVNDPATFMEEKCDILIPAATEKSIH